MELPYMLFIATDTARCEWTRHGIRDCFLERCKGFMSGIRTTKGIPIVALQADQHILKVIRRNDNIRIEYNEKITFGAFEAVVSCEALTFIFFIEIMYVQ